MTVELSFYEGGGVDSIGGNKFLLRVDDTALFLDFGQSFSLEKKFFDEFLGPRPFNGLGDLFALKLLPPIKGIYRDDLDISAKEWWEKLRSHEHFREMHIDGVLLSHAHLDHSGYISFLDPSIPVISSLTTAVLTKAIQDTGRTNFQAETCYINPRECHEENLLKTNSRTSYRQRQYHVFGSGEPSPAFHDFWAWSPTTRELYSRPVVLTNTGEITVGQVLVKFFPVDHSIPGAGAFAIMTPIGWIVYTGDFRLHGREGGLTRQFVEEAARLKPVVLICEGTRANVDRVHQEKHFTEDDVAAGIDSIISRAKGLVIADFGARNVERLLSFLQASEKNGRKLAITTRDAYLLESLHLINEPRIPNPFLDDRIAVYVEAKASPATWEKNLKEKYGQKCISATEVHNAQNKYVLCFSYYELNELIDIEPDRGGTYLYSSTEAFNEEMAIDAEKLIHWIEHFGFELFGSPLRGKEEENEHILHVGGHVLPNDLIECIETIHPQRLIPVHTESREFFQSHFGNRHDIQLFLPEINTNVEI